VELKQKIKTIILDERRENLNNSFNELEYIRDDSYRTQRIFEISSKLIKEGYDINEIDIKGQLDKIDFKSVLSDSLLSSVKEYAIQYILKEVFGAGSGFSTTAAQFFADYNPINLLKPFKNMQTCMSNDGMPKLVDGLLEVLVRYIASNQTNNDRNDYGLNIKSISTTYGGNLLGEVIKESNLSESISEKFCKVIH
jgi:hypothetical protein